MGVKPKDLEKCRQLFRPNIIPEPKAIQHSKIQPPQPALADFRFPKAGFWILSPALSRLTMPVDRAFRNPQLAPQLPARLLAMRGYPRHNLRAGLSYRLCFHHGNMIRGLDRLRA